MHEHTSNNKNKLSAIFDVDSFFYGIFDESYTLQYSERKSFSNCISSDDFLGVLNSLPILNSEYEEIHLACKSSKQQFVPSKLNFEVQSNDNYSSLINDTFLNQSIDVVWSMDDQLISAIQEKFPRKKILHVCSVFADFVYPSQRNVFLAHFGKDAIHLLHYGNGEFKYYNHFNVRSAEDYLYFIMQGYKILNLDPLNDTLKISGDLFADSKLYKLISRYVVNLDFIQPERFKLKSDLPDSVKHRYFDLYANVICG